MHFAEVSVPGVPTTFSRVLVNHQSIFPSDSHPFLLEDAHNKPAPQTSRRGLRLDAAPELYTVLCTIVVCGVGFFFRGFRPSTSAIMSLTAFAVKSLSLKSDIRFSAPALKPMTGSTLTSFEQCVEECIADEGHTSHN